MSREMARRAHATPANAPLPPARTPAARPRRRTGQPPAPSRIPLAVSLTVLLAVLSLGAAFAVAAPHFGVRAGLTFDPDQIHVGAHARVLDLTPDLAFVPNAEFGFGDDATIITLNGELAYTWPTLAWRGWRPYAGGGIGLVFTNVDVPDAPEGFDDSQQDIGMTLLAGMRKTLNIGHECFGEVKFGIEDQPDIKLTLGLTFY